MAGTSARNAAIHLNGFVVSTFFRTFSESHEVTLEETATFGTTRTGTEDTPLLQQCMMSLAGFWNSTATTGVNAVLKAALAAATRSVLCLWPRGETVGVEGVAFLAEQASRKQTFPVEGVARVEAEFKSSSTEGEEVVCLHPMAQEIAGGNGTIVDNGAATADGGSAYIQSTEVGTTMTGAIHHSDDEFAADDDVLCTFTAITTDNKAERVTFAGAVKRYTRFVWTQTGNTTFSGALHRN